MTMDWFSLFIYLSKKFKNCMNFLMITSKIKSHHVHILTDFDRFMCNKTKCKMKKYFCRYCLQYISTEKVLQEHKEVF